LRGFEQAGSVIELYNHAMATINAGEYEEALAILEPLVPRIEDPALRAEGERHVEELREVTHHNRLVGRLNRAVKLANSGDVEGAARLLERILADEPGDDLRQKVETILSSLRE